MITWRIEGTPAEIIDDVLAACPEAADALSRARQAVPYIKREISEYQAYALYWLARPWRGKEGVRILEIGTAWGYSAAVMAEAAPDAEIVTLNQPKPAEFERAKRHLSRYANVTPLQVRSWDYLDLSIASGDDRPWHMVFVDGDHGAVERDLPWWDRLAPGGLLLLHDYSPDGSWRPCQPVKDAVDRWAASKGLEPDVLVVDDRGVGMVGFVRE